MEKLLGKGLMYQRKDHYYKKAKKEGLASRAVYKLKEIQKKYRLIKKGDRVLELGCAPGGWFEEIAQEIGPKGELIGIDRLPLKIKLPPNAVFIQKNIEEGLSLDKNVDVLLSDLSPDLSGIPFRDTYRSYELALLVLCLTEKFLKGGGNLVLKIFPGEEAKKLQDKIKKSFESFKIFVPEATRKASSEVYWIGLKKRKGI